MSTWTTYRRTIRRDR